MEEASPSLPPLSDKPALRRWARRRRAVLPLPALSALLVERLSGLPEYTAAARHVLLYLAMPGEVNVEALLERDRENRRRWYAPRCAPDRRLALHPFDPARTSLVSGPFDIREPDASQVPEADPGIIDLVIVPALLFSETGDRLGYGGGYYDRFLPRLSASCVRVGALPDALVLPFLPRDAWDQTLDIIVTETRLLRRRKV